MNKKVYAKDDFIDQLLTGWILANQRYVGLLGQKDCCWWYNERTNVSVLAGAAWLLGWTAIEEYPSDKGKKGCLKEDTDTSRGRVDLYISSNNDDIAIEAKHAWYNLDNIASGNNTVRCKVNKASEDANCLKEQADRHFSATFIVFYTEKNSQELIAEEHMEKLINNVISDRIIENISYAYIIDSQFKFQNTNGYYYPSVALILEKVNG